MATERVSTKNDFKANYIIYYALIVGQVLITLVISYLMMGADLTFSWDMSNPFHLIAPIIMLSCISVSSLLFTKKMEEAKKLTGLYSKLEHYRSAIILRSAVLEGVNLVCLIYYLLEQNYFFLLLFFIGLGAFLLIRPSEEMFREKYRLTEEERIEFRKMVNK
jgi:hypothetical protein